MWRTTSRGRGGEEEKEISIHVPRVEDDYNKLYGREKTKYFNPRPPCGGRPRCYEKRKKREKISIHVPRVEDDHSRGFDSWKKGISIHVPRVEDDDKLYAERDESEISIHVPRVEDDVL